MGFYGNVANSNKTAFSFDKTYASRVDMDASAQSDGVFLGRYVLVEYDEPVIEGYAKAEGGQVVSFHTNVSRSAQSKITPRAGRVYHDLTLAGAYNAFYEWVSTNDGSYYRPVTANTGYAASFAIDVLAYGRGYDSTAWQKTWNEQEKAYKYVMVAELNTIVPNFHLIVDAPSNIMAAPYFDSDATTNVDYFLHQQASFGQSIRSAGKTSKNYEINDGRADNTVHDAIDLEYSDEIIQKKTQRWNADSYGNQYSTIIDTSISSQRTQGDIYYNKAGFDRSKRTLSPRDTNDESKSAIANTINYDYDRSGRLYFDRSSLKSSGSWWQSGQWADDMMEWYIHLPVLGDAICELWDKLYGFSTVDAHRYLNVASKRGEDSSLVTYDPSVAIGVINTTRDILGYVLVDLAEQDASIANILNNSDFSAADRKNALNNLLKNDAYISYDNTVTKYLYYTKLPGTVEVQDVKEYYYAYTYWPQYEPVHKEGDVWKYNTSTYGDRTFTDHELFYKNSNNEFKLVNKENNQFQLSDGSYVEPYVTLYGELPRWRLTMLATPKEDSIYGLILHLHELIGEENDLRTFETLNGSLNILKDVVQNIDSQMKPFTLISTDIDGHVINAVQHVKNTSNNKWEPTNQVVEFPYFKSADSQEILDCSGHWRLPVSYKLETLSLYYHNLANSSRYFDVDYNGVQINNTANNNLQGYYGNSCLHAVVAEDTIGEAIKKMQHEMADIQYQTPTVNSFTLVLADSSDTSGSNAASSNLTFIENGASFTKATLKYTLNKGPRQALRITRIAQTAATLVDINNIDPNYYVTDPTAYAASASGTVEDTNAWAWTPALTDKTLTWRIETLDERDARAYKDVSGYYCNKVYWGVGDAITNLDQISSYGGLVNIIGSKNKLLRSKASATYTGNVASNKYFYYIQPASWATPTFKIGGFEGGMDELTTHVELLPSGTQEGSWQFTNQSGYTTAYRVWRSTNDNLGNLSVVVS